jgi:hypothetical protein
MSPWKRKYHGMPQQEATADLHVQPLLEDIENAKRGDPENCVFARCLKRVLHTSTAVIFKSTAYVEVLSEKGDKILRRYTIDGAARKCIDTFDRTGKIAPAGFILRAPTPTRTLDAKVAYNAKHPRKQKIKGTRTWKVAKPKEHDFSFLRDGTGMVSFRKEEGLTTRAAAAQ